MTEHLRPFREGKLWGFCTANGHVVVRPQFDSVGSFSEGLARVKVQGKWGFVNASGDMVIEPQFEQARHFQGGIAKVQQGAIWGYIDPAGFFVEKLDAGQFVDKTGEFISKEDYQKWGKHPGYRNRD